MRIDGFLLSLSKLKKVGKFDLEVHPKSFTFLSNFWGALHKNGNPKSCKTFWEKEQQAQKQKDRPKDGLLQKSLCCDVGASGRICKERSDGIASKASVTKKF